MALEHVQNNRFGQVDLTICIPSYNDDASGMINLLSTLPRANQTALLLLDDGAGNTPLNDRHKIAIQNYSGQAIFISSPVNLGRSKARNLLTNQAKTDWVLLLDADMLPDKDQFIETYLNAISEHPKPGLIAGGFSLDQVTPAKTQTLHAAHAAGSECLSAKERSIDPGRYVFTSNILVHKNVLKTIDFDEAFIGWGWEDVDWGLRVAKRFPIIHIDNTATHLGLETDDRLIEKFGNSGKNYALLIEKHPTETKSMPLTRAIQRLRRFSYMSGIFKAIAKTNLFPTRVRVTCLKIYRAMRYAEHIKKVQNDNSTYLSRRL